MRKIDEKDLWYTKAEARLQPYDYAWCSKNFGSNMTEKQRSYLNVHISKNITQCSYLPPTARHLQVGFWRSSTKSGREMAPQRREVPKRRSRWHFASIARAEVHAIGVCRLVGIFENLSLWTMDTSERFGEKTRP